MPTGKPPTDDGPRSMPWTVHLPVEGGYRAADLEHPAPLPRIGERLEYIDETGQRQSLPGGRGDPHPAVGGGYTAAGLGGWRLPEHHTPARRDAGATRRRGARPRGAAARLPGSRHRTTRSRNDRYEGRRAQDRSRCRRLHRSPTGAGLGDDPGRRPAGRRTRGGWRLPSPSGWRAGVAREAGEDR